MIKIYISKPCRYSREFRLAKPRQVSETTGIACTKDGQCYPLDSDFLSCLKNAFKCNKTKYTVAKL